MEKITNIKQATDTVYAALKKINPAIQKDDVCDIIIEEILESTEHVLTEADIKFLEENEEDISAIDTYLQKKLPDYKDILPEIVADMISDEALDID